MSVDKSTSPVAPAAALRVAALDYALAYVGLFATLIATHIALQWLSDAPLALNGTDGFAMPSGGGHHATHTILVVPVATWVMLASAVFAGTFIALATHSLVVQSVSVVRDTVVRLLFLAVLAYALHVAHQNNMLDYARATWTTVAANVVRAGASFATNATSASFAAATTSAAL
jgi:hypothetical protein